MRRNLGIAIVVLCIWVFVGFRMFNKSSNSGPGAATTGASAFPGTGSETDWNEAMSLDQEARNQYHAGNYDKTIALATQAISKYPDDSNFYNVAAVALCDRGRPQDAETAEQLLRKAISLKPGECKLWQNLSRSMAIQNRMPDAKTALEKALECSPTEQQEAAIKANIEHLDEAIRSSGQ
jgi:Flp pilus assembly protein TadD